MYRQRVALQLTALFLLVLSTAWVGFGAWSIVDLWLDVLHDNSLLIPSDVLPAVLVAIVACCSQAVQWVLYIHLRRTDRTPTHMLVFRLGLIASAVFPAWVIVENSESRIGHLVVLSLPVLSAAFLALLLSSDRHEA